MAQHALRADTERRVVYLLDVGSAGERRLVEAWITQQGGQPGAPCEMIALPSSRRPRRGRPQPQLEACIAAEDDPLLSPLRVAWFPADAPRRGWRRLLRLLALGDPRDPG